MKILNSFTLKNVKLNKKRSIVTIIGIVLSTALICAVIGMFSSFKKTIVNAVIDSEGDFHTAIINVSQDDLKYYKYNNNVKKYYLEKAIGYVQEKYDGYPILAYDQNELESIKLDEGRLPKNSNEIIVSNYTNYKLNENITLDAYVVPNNYEEVIENGFDDVNEEQFKQKLNYKVVGIYSRYSLMGCITKLEDTNGLLNIKLVYKDIKKTYKITDEIKKDYEVQYNKDLLMWNMVSSNENTMKTLYYVIAVILGIIIITSVFVIRNSFEISITEKMRQFGMLASIGATKKQIRKSVLFEGFILGVIGIPIGILLGYTVIHILILFSNVLLSDMISGTDKFVVDIPLFAILLSIILGAITILLSSLKSAFKASKVSPIVAIRSNTDIKIKKKKLKNSKLISKIFGVGGVISYKNLKRNKKKYRTTVISLVVSISVFIALYFFMNSLFSVSNVFYKESYYNVQVFRMNNEEGKLDDYNRIIETTNPDNYMLIKEKDVMLKSDKANDSTITLTALGDNAYKRYIKKLGLNYNDVKDKIIYLENTTERDTKTKKLIKNYNFKKNDVLNLYNENKTYNIEIAKVTSYDKQDLYQLSGVDGLFIVSDSLLDKIDNVQLLGGLKIKTDDPNTLEDNIDKLKIDNITVSNYERMAKQVNKLVLWISVFLYGFIIVITLIGVTNIFNTITTSMSLRSKEFAMLKSIGMTKKEFNRMIRLESLLYGLKSLVIGCLIGTGLSYLIYKSFANSIDFGFSIPITAIIISTIFIFLVVGMTMKYSLNKINKQNIIETIRRDNI